MNKRLVWGVVAAAVVVGGAAWAWRNHLSQGGGSDGPAAAAADDGAPLSSRLVSVQVARSQDIEDVRRINGRLALNAMKVQIVSARVAGRVEKIMAFEGAPVQAGEALALLYSPDYVSAQNEFLLARRTVGLLAGSSTADLLDDAKGTMESARNRLRVLGVSEADIDALDRTGQVQPNLVIRPAISGRLIKRNIDPGGYLDTGASLGTVADLGTLWFQGEVYESDLTRLREGQAVSITLTSLPDARISGRISFISPTIDPATHTAQVRVDLANPQGLLKPDMFAVAEVRVGALHVPVVPRAAVVQDGAESFVMIKRDERRFERVPVKAMPTPDPNMLAIVQGVKDGDAVVVEGGVLVDRSLPATPEPAPAASSGGKGS